MHYSRKKRTSVILLTVISIIMVLVSGCSQVSKDKENLRSESSSSSSNVSNDTSSSSDTPYFNPEYSKTGMKTVSNDEYNPDNEMIYMKFGMAISSPVFKEFKERLSGGDSSDRVELNYDTDKSLELHEEIKGKSFESIDDSVLQKMKENTINYGALFCIKDNDENAKTTLEEFRGRFSIVEQFAKNEGYTYYYAYNDNISAYSNATLSNQEKANIEKLSKEMANIPNISCLFPGIDACGPITKEFK